MPSLNRFLKKMTAKDKAVYWGNPTVAGDGSNTYDAPVEIDCLWKGKQDLMFSIGEKEVVGRALVYVTCDVDEQGMLYHGRLKDLTDAQKSDPRKVKDAYEITRFFKVPSMLNKGEYNRVVYINMY